MKALELLDHELLQQVDSNRAARLRALLVSGSVLDRETDIELLNKRGREGFTLALESEGSFDEVSVVAMTFVPHVLAGYSSSGEPDEAVGWLIDHARAHSEDAAMVSAIATWIVLSSWQLDNEQKNAINDALSSHLTETEAIASVTLLEDHTRIAESLAERLADEPDVGMTGLDLGRLVGRLARDEADRE